MLARVPVQGRAAFGVAPGPRVKSLDSSELSLCKKPEMCGAALRGGRWVRIPHQTMRWIDHKQG